MALRGRDSGVDRWSNFMVWQSQRQQTDNYSPVCGVSTDGLRIHRTVKEACVDFWSAFLERQTRLAAGLAVPKTRATGKAQELCIRTAASVPMNQHSISLKCRRDYHFPAGIEPASDELELASPAFRSKAGASRNFVEAQSSIIHAEQGPQYGSGLPLHSLMHEVDVERPL